jgi:hypothetical protein
MLSGEGMTYLFAHEGITLYTFIERELSVQEVKREG